MVPLEYRNFTWLLSLTEPVNDATKSSTTSCSALVNT